MIDPVYEEALNVTFDSDAGDNLTVRDYLQALLLTLWKEKEGFCGKRPFGNSGWEYDLYTPLVRAGLIEGVLDEDGYVEYINKPKADKFIKDLIAYAFQRSHHGQ